MPIDYRILQAERLVVATFEGLITWQEIRTYRSRLRADPGFSADMDSLADMSGVTSFEPTADEMRSIVLDDPFGPTSRHAAIAPNAAVYGMLRMYELTADRSEALSRVFRDAAAAQAWLDS